MTNSECAKCNGIIHTASAAAGAVGFGLAQIPGSDSVPLVGIQTTMIISLGSVFGKKLDESAAKAALAGTASTVIGRSISQILIGWMPGIGNAVNATTAAGITEAIGWKIANDFDDEEY